MHEELRSAKTLRELFERALSALLAELNPERAFIAYKESGQEFTPQGTHGIDPQAIFVAGEISTELLKQVTREGKGVCLVDAIQHPGLANRTSVILSGLRSIICAPILHPSGLVVGLVYADNRLKAGAFNDTHLAFVTELCSLMSEMLVPLLKSVEPSAASEALAEGEEEEYRASRAEGIRLVQEGKLADAEAPLRRAVEIAEKFGNKDSRLAKSLGEMAEVLRQQGRIEEAERTLIRSIGIFEKLGDHHHPDLAPSLNNLAGLYYSRGNGVRAEDLYRRALKIWKETLAADDKRLAPVLYNLATIRKANGAFQEAADFFNRALAIAEKAWGVDHPHTQRCRASYQEALTMAQSPSST